MRRILQEIKCDCGGNCRISICDVNNRKLTYRCEICTKEVLKPFIESIDTEILSNQVTLYEDGMLKWNCEKHGHCELYVDNTIDLSGIYDNCYYCMQECVEFNEISYRAEGSFDDSDNVSLLSIAKDRLKEKATSRHLGNIKIDNEVIILEGSLFNNAMNMSIYSYRLYEELKEIVDEIGDIGFSFSINFGDFDYVSALEYYPSQNIKHYSFNKME